MGPSLIKFPSLSFSTAIHKPFEKNTSFRFFRGLTIIKKIKTAVRYVYNKE